MLCQRFELTLLHISVDFLRVAALVRFGSGCLDELGAKALDLLLRFASDVVCMDDRTEPFRRGDRLEAGDSDTQDQRLRRWDSAGGRDQHRQEPG